MRRIYRIVAIISVFLWVIAFWLIMRPDPPPPVRPVITASRVVKQNQAKYHQWRRETIFGIRDGRVRL
jgi:hypothetical protein